MWVYTSSFGGGMVAGDQTRLDLVVEPGAQAFFGTQASTKIYRSPGMPGCGHSTAGTVGADGLLVWAPDAVQPFRQSRYEQRQTFDLAPGAGLVLVDGFTAGRVACGERWAFDRYSSRNEVRVGGQRVFLDALHLDPADGDFLSACRGGRYHAHATLLLLGTVVRPFAATLLEDIGARSVMCRAPMVLSASPVRDGAVLRIAGEDAETVQLELRRRLSPLAALLGDDPWSRRN